MEIKVAASAGFCFGVERAVKEVYRLADSPENGRIFTVGSLIHNPHIVRELEGKGVRVISKDDFESVAASAAEGSPCTVVIRTHGVSREISETIAGYAAENPAFRVCDMTCPYVKKIHRIVSENRDRQLIVFGDSHHPEVEGIVSYAEGPAVVISSPEEALSLNFGDTPVIAVAQTTQQTLKWKKCQENLKKVCTNALISDTICRVTEERQEEARKLAGESDIMFVIGGRESSNTAKLCETAKKVLDRTYLIEEPSELENFEFTSFPKVGITAGASTPRGIIQEVVGFMSEQETKVTDEVIGSEDFAGMLEGSLKTLNTGDAITGVVTAVMPGELQVDLGAKVTGIIPYDEVTDDTNVKLTEAYKVGDGIEAVVIKVSDKDGVATLSKKKIDNRLRWKKLMDAYIDDAVIEGTVSEAVKGGVLLDYEGNRVFIPASQTGIPRGGDMNALKGQTVKAKIIEVNEGKKRAVASIRRVKSEERKEKEAAFWANIEVGKQYDGVVRSLTAYGAFVDLGGVDGMVHSSELSWTRIRKPSDVVSVGETIHVYVKDFNPETKRISLGYKTEETNPWKIFTDRYGVGDAAEVKIVSLMPFGAFAEIVPGVDGLIHISQITDHKIGSPAEVLEVGQTVNAEIVGIDNDTHQVSLSVRALMEKDEGEY